MPILEREISIYPDEVLNDVPSDGESRWWAVYTLTRQEKCLARELLKRRMAFYLPLVPKHSLIRGRRVRSFVPLFSGYLFFCGTPEDRHRALATNRISRTIPVDDQQQLLADLRQIQRLIEADVPLTIEGRLGPGDRVRVRSGSMQGIEGTVVARQSRLQLIVAVRFLQQGVSLAIDDYMVERI